MNRRHALTSLSGLTAASLLFVGTRQAFAQAQPTTLGEGEYKTQTLMVGSLSKMQSDLAVHQAVNPKVQQFAHFEVAEQTVVAQVLTDMANPPPPALDPAQQAHLADLQGLKGKPFDAAYIKAQIDGHHHLFAIQQDFLNGTPTDKDREHIAMLARAVIEMHLTLLTELQMMVGTA